MASTFNLRAIISATDLLSPVLRGQMRNMRQWQRQFNQLGKGALPMAAGLAAAIAIPARSFMELEDATKGLENTLMKKNGLTPGLEKLSAIAAQLGKDLPGTTSDFFKMATTMSAAGVKVDTLINGGLKAAAYLGAITKDIGGGYDAAADSVARLGMAFGIADKDLVGFADTMARAVNLGVGFEDANYAMSRAAGMLSGMKLQGAGVAKALLPLVAMMNQVGIKGEQAGTGLNELFRWAAPHGAKSIEEIITNLEKLYKLKPKGVIEQFTKIFGKEHGPKLLTIASGGYAEELRRFEDQADLNKKAANMLGSLSSTIDAAKGTWEGAMAIFGKAYAPEMKETANAFNNITANMGAWFEKNGSLIKAVLESVAALTALKLVSVGVAWGIGLITAAMRMNPIMIFAQAIALAAPFIYEHWGEITGFIKDSFGAAIDWIVAKWTGFTSGFYSGIDKIHNLFSGFGDMFQPGSMAPGGTRPHAMEQSGAVPKPRPNIVKAGRVSVDGGLRIDVNALPGIRVTPYATKGPISVTPNVGYRSLGMAH
jgi:hypothetical protein